MCLVGASGAGAELLAALPQPDLRLYYAWVPMLPPDDEQAASMTAERFPDRRASHYWDRERHLSRYIAERLGIGARESSGAGGGSGFAWDVYLAYRRGATDVAQPSFWMHQLAVTHAPRLDAERFRRRVEALVGPA